MKIRKQDGTLEEFDPEKLNTSLLRSGASSETRKEIIKKVSSEIQEGMTTTVIYRKAYNLLKKYEKRPEVTYRYSLRRAISDFGPSGFPFEKFVGEIFKLKGYSVLVGKKLQGKCIKHEMDVIGEKDSEILTAELKFHNKHSLRTDLQTILYIRARFDDLIAGGYYGDKTPRLAVITNTKFTSSAIRYGECAGLGLIGWNFPKRDGNLHDLVIDSGIHPLTALSSLSHKQKQHLLEQGLVMCSEVTANDARALREARGVIQESKIPKILEEIETVISCVGPQCD